MNYRIFMKSGNAIDVSMDSLEIDRRIDGRIARFTWESGTCGNRLFWILAEEIEAVVELRPGKELA